MKNGLGDLVDCLHNRTAGTHQSLGLFAIDGCHDHLVLNRDGHLAIQAKRGDETVEKLLDHWSLLVRIGCAHPCLSLSWWAPRTTLIIVGVSVAVAIVGGTGRRTRSARISRRSLRAVGSLILSLRAP